MQYFSKVASFTIYSTTILRPGDYEVYRLASNMPQSPKKTQTAASPFFVTSPKYVQSIVIANPLYSDLTHQCLQFWANLLGPSVVTVGQVSNN